MLLILLSSNIISSKVAHPTLFLRRFIYFHRDRLSWGHHILGIFKTSLILLPDMYYAKILKITDHLLLINNLKLTRTETIK